MAKHHPPLILASRSPRRRDLLAEAGYTFRVVYPDQGAEGELEQQTAPADLVQCLARQKANNVAAKISAGLVLGCDTVVVCEDRILGKPHDRDDARRMLDLLRGRFHEVYSGICLWSRPGDQVSVDFAVTRLAMEPISVADRESYLDTELWVGKAGAFGYQDRLGWIRIVQGSESNVVGLPMELLNSML